MEERQVEMGNDMENMEENCEMKGKIWQKSKLISEKIWKIWKKGKSNSDKIWKIWKKIMKRYEKYGRKPS